MERNIARAQRAKRGIWSLGNQRVSASDYKRNGNGATNEKGRQSTKTANTKKKNINPNPSKRKNPKNTRNNKTRGNKENVSRSSNYKSKSSGGGVLSSSNPRVKKHGSTLLDSAVTGLEFVAG